MSADRNASFLAFVAWAAGEGYDTAHTYDTDRSVWIAFNPMTADLWRAWQARDTAAQAKIAALEGELQRKSDAIQRLWRERDAAVARGAEIEKDAGRYRWLRDDRATEFGEPWAITRYAPGDERNSDGGTCPPDRR